MNICSENFKFLIRIYINKCEFVNFLLSNGYDIDNWFEF